MKISASINWRNWLVLTFFGPFCDNFLTFSIDISITQIWYNLRKMSSISIWRTKQYFTVSTYRSIIHWNKCNTNPYNLIQTVIILDAFQWSIETLKIIKMLHCVIFFHGTLNFFFEKFGWFGFFYSEHHIFVLRK